MSWFLGLTINFTPRQHETVRNLERFRESLGDHQVSRLLIVPSMLHASLHMPDFWPHR